MMKRRRWPWASSSMVAPRIPALTREGELFLDKIGDTSHVSGTTPQPTDAFRTRSAVESRLSSTGSTPPRGSSSKTTHSPAARTEEHTAELQSLMRSPYAVVLLKKQIT